MAAIGQLVSKRDLTQLSAAELQVLETTVCSAVASNRQIHAILKKDVQEALGRIKDARKKKKY